MMSSIIFGLIIFTQKWIHLKMQWSTMLVKRHTLVKVQLPIKKNIYIVENVQIVLPKKHLINYSIVTTCNSLLPIFVKNTGKSLINLVRLSWRHDSIGSSTLIQMKSVYIYCQRFCPQWWTEEKIIRDHLVPVITL